MTFLARNIAHGPSLAPPHLRAALVMVILASLAGCVAPGTTGGEYEEVEIDGAYYEIRQELVVGPGTGTWVAKIQSEGSELGVFFALDGALQPETLDALFILVIDRGDIHAMGNLFYDRPAPHQEGSSTTDPFDLTGHVPLDAAAGYVVVGWAGLHEAATVQIGVPFGASLDRLGLTTRAELLAPWTMQMEDAPLLREGSAEHRADGPVLFWGDLALSRMGRAELTVVGGDGTYSATVEGEAVPTVHRFASVLSGDVRVDVSTLGNGDDPGLYGFLVDLPLDVTTTNGLEVPICGTCS